MIEELEMTENNPYLLPRDIRFLIFQDFQPKDILNLSLVNKKCSQIYKDENFWMRKIYKDFPNLLFKNYNYTSYLELYKRLIMRYGNLSDIKEVDCLVYKVINGRKYTFIIDKDYNLRIIKATDTYGNDFESYLHSLFNYDLPINKPLLKNMKDVVTLNYHTLILMTDGNLYRIGYESMFLPENMKIMKIMGANRTFIQITNNVREIGGNDFWIYYITNNNDFFIKKIYEEREYEEGSSEDNALYETKYKFEYINKVRSICLNGDDFFYTDLENNSFMKNEHYVISKGNVKQLIVDNDLWYILQEFGKLSIYDYSLRKGCFILRNLYIDKLFLNSNSQIYALAKNLDLYDIKVYDSPKLINCNVLNIYDNHIIKMPLSN